MIVSGRDFYLNALAYTVLLSTLPTPSDFMIKGKKTSGTYSTVAILAGTGENVVDLIVGSLSRDVFDQRTSTGNWLLVFLGSDFALILGQIVSIRQR